MVKKSGMFFRAVPDNGLVNVSIKTNGQIAPAFPNCCVPTPRLTKLIEEATETRWYPLARKQKLPVPSLPWVVNLCADPDEYAQAMKYLSKFAHNNQLVVFNHPDAVNRSRRNVVSQILDDVPNLTVPKCVRFYADNPEIFRRTFNEEGFTYPVLVRPAASQSGRNLVRVDNESDWVRVHEIPWGGQHIYMTQFVDFKNADDEFIKIRAVCLNDEVYIRHNLFSKDWQIHAMDRDDAIVDREFEAMNDLKQNEIFQDVLRTIKSRIGLDFFGVDLGYIAADSFVLFEANAAMSILSKQHMPTYRRPEFLKIFKDIEEAAVRALRGSQAMASKSIPPK